MKIIKWTARIIGSILLLAGLGISILYLREQINNKPVYGEIKLAEAIPSLQHQSDNFTFAWNEDNLQFEISSRLDPEKILWASVPGESFLHAALGSEDFTEHRGSYFIRNKIRKRFAIQRIDAILPTPTGLLVTGKLTGDRTKTAIGFELEFSETSDREIAFSASVSSGVSCNRLYLTYQSDREEKFFGFGTQYSHFNLKGRRVPILVSEQGIGRGKQPLTFLVDLVAKSGGKWYTSYAPVPYYMTSKLRSLYLTTYDYAVFDLRKRNKVQVTVLANRIEGAILTGESPAEILESYTAYAGRMPALPDWMNDGAVIGMQGGTQKVYDVWSALKAHDTPIAAFWLQDWVGQRTTSFGKQLWWNWTLDTQHYYNWDSLLNHLAEDSIRVMGYINPYLVDISDKEHASRDLLEEARELDYLVKDKHGEVIMVQITSFSAAIVNLSNSDARDWIIQVIREEMIDAGLSGWMADFGEALPMDADLGSINSKQYHNQFPEVWTSVNAEAVSTDSTGELVYFNRSGYTKSPSSSRLFWLGDQMTAWDHHDGIKTAVTGLLSSGISGYSLNHSDIGGYTAISDRPLNITRSKELLMRWIELNAFTAVFRTHEGNLPDDNFQIYDDEEVIAHFARFAKIYRDLAPYRKQLMEEAEATGMPVTRHPFLHYPNDENFYEMSYQQFMLGPDIMVCPVLDKGASLVDVYLPPGKWKRAYSDLEIESNGTLIEAEAPIGHPAVFYLEGSFAGSLLDGQP